MHNRSGAGRPVKASTIRERERRKGTAAPDSTRLPDPPVYLNIAARREWRRMGRRLLAAGLVTNLDVSTLAAYCAVYARWADAEAKVQKTGTIIKVGSQFQPSPYLTLANKALDQMLRLMSEFGMSPASRSRLPAHERPKSHKVAESTPVKPGGDPRSYLKVVS